MLQMVQLLKYQKWPDQGLNLGPHQTMAVLYQLSYQVLAVSTTAKPYIPLTIQDNQCPLNGLCQPTHFTP